MLHSIIRFPTLAQEFRKIAKDRLSIDGNKNAHKEAVLILRQYDLDDKQQNNSKNLNILVDELNSEREKY